MTCRAVLYIDDVPGDDTIEQALAGGSPQRVGWFRFYFADERWEWSEQVQRLHGYEPGTVMPTTELVLSHKHPDDYVQVAATLDDIRRTHRTFSTRHRIIDTEQAVHDVIVIGDQLYDDDGDVIGTHGFYVDVTPTDRRARGVGQRGGRRDRREPRDDRAGQGHADADLPDQRASRPSSC